MDPFQAMPWKHNQNVFYLNKTRHTATRDDSTSTPAHDKALCSNLLENSDIRATNINYMIC